MTRFVLDASVALSWIFEDEFSDYSDFVAQALEIGYALAPVVFPLEVTNGILNAVRGNRLRAADAGQLLDALTRLHIEIDADGTLGSIAQMTLSIGIAQRLSSYDASYLELAMRRGLPLATQDARLAAAAAASGVTILQP